MWPFARELYPEVKLEDTSDEYDFIICGKSRFSFGPGEKLTFFQVEALQDAFSPTDSAPTLKFASSLSNEGQSPTPGPLACPSSRLTLRPTARARTYGLPRAKESWRTSRMTCIPGARWAARRGSTR